ncbi:hypothetical protein AAC03nite_09090 [Alicyclobacillus acidoterrestris]|uniref:YicC/YloC family endoribonuclease n=1 Tax=Alicyclobacillus suci TaxID=2816080 RepID=UPI001191CC4E|nr:YicC/YloC family endoribonuclease [Alicyclobacillus suci]GEO25124.1 hypothetical protein AAC03nite_09090 [Alicyclobacillus acidoterrestris]
MTLRSMTGYGQMTLSTEQVVVSVEMKSVNHRFQEFHLRVPKEWLQLEEMARQELGRVIHRGRVDVFVNLEMTSHATEVVVNWNLFDGLLAAEQELLRRFGSELDAHTVRDWLKHPDVVQVVPKRADSAEVERVVRACLQQAAAKLVSMREREGSRLQASFEEKLGRLEACLAHVKEHDRQAVKHKLAQLQARIEQLRIEVEPERLLQEVVLLVDKSAVDEEVVRLASHLESFREALFQTGSIGRRLDFIVQEMHREVNTIGSKALDARIASLVVEMKVLVEQLREQVQNVE